MLKAFKDMYLRNKLNKIPRSLPMLILSGEEDPVGYYGERVKKLYELYKNEGLNVQMKLYPEMRHEILNEKNSINVYSDILNWLLSHS